MGTFPIVLLLAMWPSLVTGNYVYSKQLFTKVMIRSGYNRHIRPALNITDKIYVILGISFMQLIDVVSPARFDGCCKT